MGRGLDSHSRKDAGTRSTVVLMVMLLSQFMLGEA
jgi:hypothetical protein